MRIIKKEERNFSLKLSTFATFGQLEGLRKRKWILIGLFIIIKKEIIPYPPLLLGEGWGEVVTD